MSQYVYSRSVPSRRFAEELFWFRKELLREFRQRHFLNGGKSLAHFHDLSRRIPTASFADDKDVRRCPSH